MLLDGVGRCFWFGSPSLYSMLWRDLTVLERIINAGHVYLRGCFLSLQSHAPWFSSRLLHSLWGQLMLKPLVMFSQQLIVSHLLLMLLKNLLRVQHLLIRNLNVRNHALERVRLKLWTSQLCFDWSRLRHVRFVLIYGPQIFSVLNFTLIFKMLKLLVNGHVHHLFGRLFDQVQSLPLW